MLTLVLHNHPRHSDRSIGCHLLWAEPSTLISIPPKLRGTVCVGTILVQLILFLFFFLVFLFFWGGGVGCSKRLGGTLY